ncbi:hypothetical protein Q5P01_023864 [Channa striata]|uniref:Uncharacterized protein n=1 Tax=Channa striata TaxID=64152 RepID=A0AA88IVJ3_CHASR|nr:hypothetical protein Q5P01_023864 [Channa striata]
MLWFTQPLQIQTLFTCTADTDQALITCSGLVTDGKGGSMGEGPALTVIRGSDSNPQSFSPSRVEDLNCRPPRLPPTSFKPFSCCGPGMKYCYGILLISSESVCYCPISSGGTA